ncbi:hypothetical protein, partial [Vibrio kanaloae]|uniref:hypothetical protein n=1 Tax=Vibrio kanaloae TaxID=170673 RepID=UPI0010BDE4E5
MRKYILLFLCVFPFFSYAQLYKISYVNYGACGLSNGATVSKSGIESACKDSDFKGHKISRVSFPYTNCGWASVRWGSGKYQYDPTPFQVCKVNTCPSGQVVNPETGFCEDPCKQMEGNQLGSVSFPEGTRDVVNICRNSCRAKSDMFFPAATPPYGIFTYTGESCDGSETGGGDT